MDLVTILAWLNPLSVVVGGFAAWRLKDKEYRIKFEELQLANRREVREEAAQTFKQMKEVKDSAMDDAAKARSESNRLQALVTSGRDEILQQLTDEVKTGFAKMQPPEPVVLTDNSRLDAFLIALIVGLNDIVTQARINYAILASDAAKSVEVLRRSSGKSRRLVELALEESAFAQQHREEFDTIVDGTWGHVDDLATQMNLLVEINRGRLNELLTICQFVVSCWTSARLSGMAGLVESLRASNERMREHWKDLSPSVAGIAETYLSRRLAKATWPKDLAEEVIRNGVLDEAGMKQAITLLGYATSDLGHQTGDSTAAK